MMTDTTDLNSRLDALEKRIGESLHIDFASPQDEASTSTRSAATEEDRYSPSVTSTARSSPETSATNLMNESGSTAITSNVSRGEPPSASASLSKSIASDFKPSIGVDPELVNVLMTVGKKHGGATDSAVAAAPCAADSDMAVPERKGRTLIKQLISNATQSIRSAYQADRTLRRSDSRGGAVSSGLCEDVAYVIGVQFDVLDEVLALEKDRHDQRELRDYAVHSIFKVLYDTQVECRDDFLSDLERCCAAANDFYRLSEWLEEWATELNAAHPCLNLIIKKGRSDRSLKIEPEEQMELGELLHLYAMDSTYSAQMTYGFTMETILDSTIKFDLFSSRWEKVFTSNEIIQSLIKTVEEYRDELETLIDNHVLYRKALEALIRSTIVFYVRCLVQRSARARKATIKLRKREAEKRKSSIGASFAGATGRASTRTFSFQDPVRAYVRVQGDVEMLKMAFQQWVAAIPTLRRPLNIEFEILNAISAIVGIAARVNDPEAEGGSDCIITVYHKVDRDGLVLRGFLSDIWFLVVPKQATSPRDLPPVIESKIIELEQNVPKNEVRRPSLASTSDGKEEIPGLAEVGVLLNNVYGEEALRERRRTSSSSPGPTPWRMANSAISGITNSVASLSTEATVSSAGSSAMQVASIGDMFKQQRKSWGV